ncbi:hypothetical protein FKM82_017651 [Ascaphus truei]
MRVGSSVLASCCLLVQVLGLALFLRGFFPVPVRSQSRKTSISETPPEPAAALLKKRPLKWEAISKEVIEGTISNWTSLPPPLFKRVVILMIDALRQDFVFGSKGKQFMPYVTQLLEKGTTHGFIAKAMAPTVTMPRIKVMTKLYSLVVIAP